LHLSELEFIRLYEQWQECLEKKLYTASLKRHRNKEHKKKTQLSVAFKKIIHLFTNGRVLQSGLKDCHKTFVHQ